MIGDIVHYVSRGSADGKFDSECRAAIITEVLAEEEDPEQFMSLAVLNPSGLFFDNAVRYNYEGAPGTWHDKEECDR